MCLRLPLDLETDFWMSNMIIQFIRRIQMHFGCSTQAFALLDQELFCSQLSKMATTIQLEIREEISDEINALEDCRHPVLTTGRWWIPQEAYSDRGVADPTSDPNLTQT